MADEDWESVDVSRINLKPAEKPSAQGKASSARPNSLVAAIEEATAAAAAAAVVGEDSLDPALREALQGGGADRQAGACLSRVLTGFAAMLSCSSLPPLDAPPLVEWHSQHGTLLQHPPLTPPWLVAEPHSAAFRRRV